jgi:Raf kinase inhibitor-like YbhB/YbcL family protein
MKKRPHSLAALLVALAIGGAGVAFAQRSPNMKLVSSAFSAQAQIPSRYTCEGADVSPPLAWSDVPPLAKSLVLIVDDPDAPDPRAPRMTWVHWVLYNVPPTARTPRLPQGAQEGFNDWQQEGWRGPCPPIGRHRYFFKLYALDVVLPVQRLATKAVIEHAMQGHVLARAELMGYYQKAR